MALKIFTSLPGRDGAFFGHLIPAIFYYCFSTFFLLLSLKRAKNLKPWQSFARVHIPERKSSILFRISVVLICATSVGLIEEIGSHLVNPGFRPLTHQAVYISFFIVGVIGIMESKGRLPADSIRMAMVVAFLGQSIMFADHAKHKETKADEALHAYVALISFANAAVLAYSIRDPESVRAYIASWGFMFLQGMWFTTVALYASFIDMEAQFVGTWLSLQAMAIVLIIGVVQGYCLPPSPGRDDIDNSGGEFAKLSTDEGRNDDPAEIV